MRYLRRIGVGLSVAALLWSALAISEILQRARIKIDGQVTSSETTCEQPYNNRCVTRYVLQASDGSELIYAAGPNDHSLQRRLSVGTHITKRKWEISYSIDGRRVDDFPLRVYIGVIFFGVCLSPIALRVLSQQRSAPNQVLEPTASGSDV